MGRRALFLLIAPAGVPEDARARRHALRQPHVAADDRPGADHGVAAENGRALIDGRMALSRLLLALRDAERPQGHALIELHVASEDARLSDDDARAVVDEEALADLRSGADVDARAGVCMLGDDARDHRDAGQ